ncbi:hypothetical protein D3C81_09670 [compost metagenome]
MTLNLGECIVDDSKILSGFFTGMYWREKFKLDDLDKQEDIINIVVPLELYSVNVSFLRGLFGLSIKELGVLKFNEKYIFDTDDLLVNCIKSGLEAVTRTIGLF